METGESRKEPEPPADQPDRAWRLIGIIGGVLAAVFIIGGLVVVGMFVLVAVGMSQWGSNK